MLFVFSVVFGKNHAKFFFCVSRMYRLTLFYIFNHFSMVLVSNQCVFS